MAYYLYKLVPPRPTFPFDASDAEGAAMAAHQASWQELVAGGRIVVYGPVMDPAGTWGLAVVEADSADDVRAIGDADPAVTAGVCTYEVFEMPMTTVRP